MHMLLRPQVTCTAATNEIDQITEKITELTVIKKCNKHKWGCKDLY